MRCEESVTKGGRRIWQHGSIEEWPSTLKGESIDSWIKKKQKNTAESREALDADTRHLKAARSRMCCSVAVFCSRSLCQLATCEKVQTCYWHTNTWKPTRICMFTVLPQMQMHPIHTDSLWARRRNKLCLGNGRHRERAAVRGAKNRFLWCLNDPDLREKCYKLRSTDKKGISFWWGQFTESREESHRGGVDVRFHICDSQYAGLARFFELQLSHVLSWCEKFEETNCVSLVFFPCFALMRVTPRHRRQNTL